MVDSRCELLPLLDFGSVDSESEKNLDQKFIKTKDFAKFALPDKALVLGAKGSGKSALFQMFAKYEQQAMSLSGISSNSTIIVTGTGFNDIHELSTDDFKKLLTQDNADFDQIWELYIAIKTAIKLGELGYRTGAHLKEFLKQAGIIKDFRILPIIKSLWSLVIGTSPHGVDIDIKGIKIKVGTNKSIDTQDILIEINNLLQLRQKDCWILFDKIDELFSDDYTKRKKCIESLFRVYLKFVHRFPRLKLKIFLRNDIWSTLEFVNKSHISDKCVELKWDRHSLVEMCAKRVLLQDDVKNYIADKLMLDSSELLLTQNLENVFYTIFSKQVYKGKKEAEVINWILTRIADGLGGTYPRELINLGNFSKDIQIDAGITEKNCLISGNSIKKAFFKVSTVKCDTYLSEFPALSQHFQRFSGQTKSKFKRKELFDLMKGLTPNGNLMIQQLYETGILEPIGIRSYSADLFTIPKLFRTGLGLVLRGRP